MFELAQVFIKFFFCFFLTENFCVQKSRNVQLGGGEATILPDQIRQETLNVQNADRLASLHIREVCVSSLRQP
jgi:hypothetical protein